MADLVDVKLIDGTARTVRELFTGRKYGLDYYQREYTWTESNVTELVDDLTTSFSRTTTNSTSAPRSLPIGPTSSDQS